MRFGLFGRAWRPAGAEGGTGGQGIEVLPAAPERAADITTAASPHVLVAVSGAIPDRELIRQGRVLADLLIARLTVLYAFRLGACDRRRGALRDDRAYTHSLGAQLVELPTFSEIDGLAEYARTRAVTHVVISETSSAAALVERLQDVDCYFVPMGGKR